MNGVDGLHGRLGAETAHGSQHGDVQLQARKRASGAGEYAEAVHIW
jgi:hypothetical protein